MVPVIGPIVRRFNFNPMRRPSDAREQAVLANVAEWQQARSEARELGLPVHPDPPKTWDTLLALGTVLRHVSSDVRVIDAGGERYSALLPSLVRYGYRDLAAINLAFDSLTTRGPIRYVPGDATRMPWPDGTVGAITCLSVIEHGVPIDAFLAECARLLQPGGVLVISTDYWPTPVDTGGREAYGTPIRIFDRAGLARLVERAVSHGLVPTSPIDDVLAVDPERAVTWRRFDLHYTFALLTFRRQ